MKPPFKRNVYVSVLSKKYTQLIKAPFKDGFLFLYLVNVYLTYESPFKRKVSVVDECV